MAHITAHLLQMKPIAVPAWPDLTGDGTFTGGETRRERGCRPPGLTETGLGNTRVPWAVPQGTLVPCVTTSSPHA
jgi:hypothetical protein